MDETRTEQITVKCRDVDVAVTYANGLGLVHPPDVTVCHGYKVRFHFAGPPGIADIIPKDPDDASWLEMRDISVPGEVEVDTTPSNPGAKYRYSVVINVPDRRGSDFSVTIDPIIRPL